VGYDDLVGRVAGRRIEHEDEDGADDRADHLEDQETRNRSGRDAREGVTEGTAEW
jgi:hypothetical protein